jgi:hypothetical protein
MTVPTEVRDRVCALMERFERDQWATEIEARLRNGTITELDPELRLRKLDGDALASVMTEAEEEWQYGQNIILQRKALHTQIDEAHSQVRMALAQLRNLDELGDVEYMGGCADVEHYLHEAGRALRSAQALKPSNKDGEV